MKSVSEDAHSSVLEGKLSDAMEGGTVHLFVDGPSGRQLRSGTAVHGWGTVLASTNEVDLARIGARGVERQRRSQLTTYTRLQWRTEP